MESRADDEIPVCELYVLKASQTMSFFRCSFFLPDRRLMDRVISRMSGVGVKIDPNGKMN